MSEGLTLFGVAPQEKRLPEPEYSDGSFFEEDQTSVWGWDQWQKYEWMTVDDDRQ